MTKIIWCPLWCR